MDPLSITVVADPELGLWGISIGDSPLTLRDPSGAAVEHALSAGGEQAPQVRTPELASLALCDVGGTVTLAGGDRAPQARELSLRGARATLTVERKLDSARFVAAWLPGGGTVALLALRAARAAGQDKDQIEVALAGLTEPDADSPPTTVFDPRLSTAYGTDGTPRRFGLELWLGRDEDGDQHPLRVGGEALAAAAGAAPAAGGSATTGTSAPATDSAPATTGTSAAATVTAAGATVEAHPFRTRAQGREGLGIYVLVRPA